MCMTWICNLRVSSSKLYSLNLWVVNYFLQIEDNFWVTIYFLRVELDTYKFMRQIIWAEYFFLFFFVSYAEILRVEFCFLCNEIKSYI